MPAGISNSQPYGYVQAAVTTVQSLPATIPAGATYAVIVATTNGFRYRDDGTDPDATHGIPVAAGASITYDGPLAKLRVVSQTGTSTLDIAYYGARR